MDGAGARVPVPAAGGMGQPSKPQRPLSGVPVRAPLGPRLMPAPQPYHQRLRDLLDGQGQENAHPSALPRPLEPRRSQGGQARASQQQPHLHRPPAPAPTPEAVPGMHIRRLALWPSQEKAAVGRRSSAGGGGGPQGRGQGQGCEVHTPRHEGAAHEEEQSDGLRALLGHVTPRFAVRRPEGVIPTPSSLASSHYVRSDIWAWSMPGTPAAAGLAAGSPFHGARHTPNSPDALHRRLLMRAAAAAGLPHGAVRQSGGGADGSVADDSGYQVPHQRPPPAAAARLTRAFSVGSGGLSATAAIALAEAAKEALAAGRPSPSQSQDPALYGPHYGPYANAAGHGALIERESPRAEPPSSPRGRQFPSSLAAAYLAAHHHNPAPAVLHPTPQQHGALHHLQAVPLTPRDPPAPEERQPPAPAAAAARSSAETKPGLPLPQLPGARPAHAPASGLAPVSKSRFFRQASEEQHRDRAGSTGSEQGASSAPSPPQQQQQQPLGGDYALHEFGSATLVLPRIRTVAVSEDRGLPKAAAVAGPAASDDGAASKAPRRFPAALGSPSGSRFARVRALSAGSAHPTEVPTLPGLPQATARPDASADHAAQRSASAQPRSRQASEGSSTGARVLQSQALLPPGSHAAGSGRRSPPAMCPLTWEPPPLAAPRALGHGRPHSGSSTPSCSGSPRSLSGMDTLTFLRAMVATAGLHAIGASPSRQAPPRTPPRRLIAAAAPAAAAGSSPARRAASALPALSSRRTPPRAAASPRVSITSTGKGAGVGGGSGAGSAASTRRVASALPHASPRRVTLVASPRKRSAHASAALVAAAAAAAAPGRFRSRWIGPGGPPVAAAAAALVRSNGGGSSILDSHASAAAPAAAADPSVPGSAAPSPAASEQLPPVRAAPSVLTAMATLASEGDAAVGAVVAPAALAPVAAARFSGTAGRSTGASRQTSSLMDANPTLLAYLVKRATAVVARDKETLGRGSDEPSLLLPPPAFKDLPPGPARRPGTAELLQPTESAGEPLATDAATSSTAASAAQTPAMTGARSVRGASRGSALNGTAFSFHMGSPAGAQSALHTPQIKRTRAAAAAARAAAEVQAAAEAKAKAGGEDDPSSAEEPGLGPEGSVGSGSAEESARGSSRTADGGAGKEAGGAGKRRARRRWDLPPGVALSSESGVSTPSSPRVRLFPLPPLAVDPSFGSDASGTGAGVPTATLSPSRPGPSASGASTPGAAGRYRSSSAALSLGRRPAPTDHSNGTQGAFPIPPPAHGSASSSSATSVRSSAAGISPVITPRGRNGRGRGGAARGGGAEGGLVSGSDCGGAQSSCGHNGVSGLTNSSVDSWCAAPSLPPASLSKAASPGSQALTLLAATPGSRQPPSRRSSIARARPTPGPGRATVPSPSSAGPSALSVALPRGSCPTGAAVTSPPPSAVSAQAPPSPLRRSLNMHVAATAGAVAAGRAGEAEGGAGAPPGLTGRGSEGKSESVRRNLLASFKHASVERQRGSSDAGNNASQRAAPRSGAGAVDVVQMQVQAPVPAVGGAKSPFTSEAAQAVVTAALLPPPLRRWDQPSTSGELGQAEEPEPAQGPKQQPKLQAQAPRKESSPRNVVSPAAPQPPMAPREGTPSRPASSKRPRSRRTANAPPPLRLPTPPAEPRPTSRSILDSLAGMGSSPHPAPHKVRGRQVSDSGVGNASAAVAESSAYLTYASRPISAVSVGASSACSGRSSGSKHWSYRRNRERAMLLQGVFAAASSLASSPSGALCGSAAVTPRDTPSEAGAGAGAGAISGSGSGSGRLMGAGSRLAGSGAAG
ncbi:hypothetical protein HYH03_009003 [Edaphochlamys debaryana]|uniref:Uncharacterized protein n=1 Tax=Edaphochlamys debaryana TaxID=47281 RepID=A0A836BZ16_9CHLO|nr:hypothetical protein HYH03_009003 [Edaphochlamys debaryana]|eukprot:KAG2492849.1 hypothetical protein HYH03_009003 [Edaphochlamys debaryana]